ncbi:MAG: aminoacyl-tRNA hydrolase [Bacilli bacterium]|nr:aminoacyl-tRNA hydrolase [Bacilli bacterium]
MKLIVGLGNPGKEYVHTRHNMGFEFIDYFLEKKGIVASWSNKFNGLSFQTNLHGEKVLFLKPQSYMNLSGGVVRKYVEYFNIETSDILVLSDDLDLMVGNFKLRDKGSSGGHNGLKDIEANLGTQEYKRLKIGISKNKDYDTKDYVLGRLSKEELDSVHECYSLLVSVLDDYFSMDFHDLMSKYNRKNR